MTASPVMGCLRCGTTIAPGVKFCPNCGLGIGIEADASRTMVESSAEGASSSPQVALPSPDVVLPILRRATAGEYDVHGLVGTGGMAYVFAATEVALQRKVAIKVMVPALVPDPSLTERFKREARTAASLSHPAIIPIHAVRETEQLVYFVMKFIEGRTLETILALQGALPTGMAQNIVAQVAGGLAFAHRRGVVHRDVKPANILIDEHGFAVVTDFGIAKVNDAKKLTSTGSILGTPHYMAPEQFAGQNVGPASDQYGLGAVAYECLVGAPPFNGASIAEVMKGHLFDAPVPVRTRRGDCPPAFADVVMRMLAKSPAQRYASLDDVVKRLGGAPGGQDTPIREALGALARASDPQRPRMTPTSSPPTAMFDGPMQATMRPTPQPMPVRSWRLAAGIGAVVLGIVAWWTLGRQPTALNTPTPQPVAQAPLGAVAAPGDTAVPPTLASSRTATSPDAPSADRSVRPSAASPRLAAPPARATETTPASPPAGTATLKIGSRAAGTVLYVNGAAKRTLDGLADVAIPLGTVRLELRLAGCAVQWDSTITVRAGDMVRVGYRLQECQP
jgi:eukaryotic-like serine/threonine-protein kinase